MSVQVQQTMAWLLHWYPRLQLLEWGSYSVSLPEYGTRCMLIICVPVCLTDATHEMSLPRQGILSTCEPSVSEHWNMAMRGPGWLLLGDDQCFLQGHVESAWSVQDIVEAMPGAFSDGV